MMLYKNINVNIKRFENVHDSKPLCCQKIEKAEITKKYEGLSIQSTTRKIIESCFGKLTQQNSTLHITEHDFDDHSIPQNIMH